MFEGLPELATLSRSQRRTGERGGVDVRLARGDDHDALRVFLHDLAQGVMEDELDQSSIDRLASVVADLSLDVCDLLAGKICG